MAVFFDYDAETGVTEHFDYDPVNDSFSIISTQDVSHFLDRMKAIRNNPEISAKGIREEWWAYCSIPVVVELELRKRGLHLENKDHMKAILKVINTEYPYLKYTDKKHT